MDVETNLVNRVANSKLKTINLEDYFPDTEITGIDLKDYLFKGLILKEKEFRETLKETAWETYNGKFVHVFCSTDAIIPMWAYMLISTYLQPQTDTIYFGTLEQALSKYYTIQIDKMDWSIYEGLPVVIKGCSHHPVPPSAYMDLTTKLRPVARSIMFGEPCSTVPIFKKSVRRTE